MTQLGVNSLVKIGANCAGPSAACSMTMRVRLSQARPNLSQAERPSPFSP